MSCALYHEGGRPQALTFDSESWKLVKRNAQSFHASVILNCQLLPGSRSFINIGKKQLVMLSAAKTGAPTNGSLFVGW
jgi:hypothetical protein